MKNDYFEEQKKSSLNGGSLFTDSNEDIRENHESINLI